MHYSTEKLSFHFVNISFTLSAYYVISQCIVAESSLFTLYDALNVFGQCSGPCELSIFTIHPFFRNQAFQLLAICVYTAYP